MALLGGAGIYFVNNFPKEDSRNNNVFAMNHANFANDITTSPLRMVLLQNKLLISSMKRKIKIELVPGVTAFNLSLQFVDQFNQTVVSLNEK